MKQISALTLICLFSLTTFATAQVSDSVAVATSNTPLLSFKRLSVGGYGEAVYQHNFFSDSPFRYQQPAKWKEGKDHAHVDLPHAVINMDYNFGKGWSFCTEIEFEHGGTETAVEYEAEEAGEFEREIERGGEVALEQFWLQKSFSRALNLRAGHIVVPVGATNYKHMPNEFFGVYRPEGENTIFPCTWHETGIEVWGVLGKWRYELMMLPALNSNYFNETGWVHNGSASAYEFRMANNLALAARVDNNSIPGLRLSLSGYVAQTFRNDVSSAAITFSQKYGDVKGLVYICAFDFKGSWGGLVIRGNADYGFLDEADIIATYNKNLTHAAESPFPRTLTGEAAYAVGMEAGYDILRPFRAKMGGRKLYIFGRYDNYESYIPAGVRSAVGWTHRQCFAAGINYQPIPQIIIKAEGGIRTMQKPYNDEPWFALGITWAGMFN